MFPFFKKLFTGESEFTGAARGLVFGLLAAIATGQLAIPDKWKPLAVLLGILGGAMKGGQSNPVPPEPPVTP